MAIKYPQYAGRNGVSNLDQKYFNPIWQDIDRRIDALEKAKISWEAAVAELTEFGLERIDTTLTPILDAATDALNAAEADALALQQLIADADVQAQLDAALTAQNAQVESDLDDLEAAMQSQIDTLQAQVDTLEPLVLAGL